MCETRYEEKVLVCCTTYSNSNSNVFCIQPLVTLQIMFFCALFGDIQI